MSQAAAKPRSIHVKPNASGFGAEITGLDLSKPLPPDVLAEVHRAWADHAVVWFPDQPLTHDELEAFTLQIGPFGHDPFIAPMEGRPHILELRREPNEKARNFGAGWHSDWSFQEEPPAATILHSKVTPPVGGDTLYADCTRAYDALSDEMKKVLSGLTAVHSAALPYGTKGIFAQEKEQRTMKIIVSKEAEKTCPHPLVRTHPVTGRKALYVSPVYTVGIESMTHEESAAILGFLYTHMTKDEFVYRHKWRENMLTMWDNRCTLHFADGGYDGHLRVMHRTTVAGDVPH
ncbi:Taurine dioxygenase [Parvibaculum lavamentivorans DS-1]|uniref:Taurine dioxygenase n=1 Tax=Parvibaculum lavamentivorans (strain DS-1 / DSM 13023 / NCIMB 13966) TaxID=402881 RepID=A7HRB9_PARL1|nr:TauD/TfdA family dioxygenase [Parvibaculum lavamentivorans]ABS62452.1 Taurine dioxygenase [Parvibaculum lavamentivorans DS-1]